MIARLVVLEITGRHKTIEPGSKSSTKLYTIYDENGDVPRRGYGGIRCLVPHSDVVVQQRDGIMAPPNA